MRKVVRQSKFDDIYQGLDEFDKKVVDLLVLVCSETENIDILDKHIIFDEYRWLRTEFANSQSSYKILLKAENDTIYLVWLFVSGYPR